MSKNLYDRFNRGRQPKDSTENKKFFFFNKKTSTPREPESEPAPRNVSKDQAKKEIVETEKKNQDEIIKKNEENLEDKKKNEKAIESTKPNFDRTALNQEKKGQEPSTAPWTQVGIEGIFASIWTHEDTDLFRDKVYKQYSFYTPNAMSMWESLKASHQILCNNEHLRYVFQDYMSFPTTLYYGVLYYIQILRVREYHGQNNDEESKFIRKFERKFDYASLPITGFLFPFFSSLASYNPKDSRMTYIVPSLNAMFRASTAEDITDYRLADDANSFMQPNIPLLYDFWKAFCTSDDLPDRYKMKNTFIPRHAAGNNLTLGSTYFAHATSTAKTIRILGSWGIESAHPETWTKYLESAEYWRDTKFASSGPTVGTLPQGGIANISIMLRMQNKMDWFSDCITCAIEHAKFFKHPKTLADVDYSAGMEVGFTGTMSFPKKNKIRTGAAWVWYPKLYDDGEGTLKWYEDQVKDYHKLNFRHTMTNCSVTVNWIHWDGTTDVDVPSTGLPDEADGTWQGRWGPWYDNTAQGQPMDNRTTSMFGSSAAAFDVFDRRNILVRNHFYLGKPE